MIGAALAILAGAAAAQEPVCGPHATIAAALLQRYGEAPVGRGLAREGVLIEILASPDGSSWTMLAIGPRGIACAVDAGEGWQVPAAAPEGEPG